MSKVYFIGAGPGDPDLITVKGKKIIEKADVIIFAGSLVNEAVLNSRKKDALIYNSAGMTLEEVIFVMDEGIRAGKLIARVHTGDPSIYGAIREQIDILKSRQISFEVVPGVSSFTAAASSLGMEFTLPGVTQTVICTRIAGRTPVPEKESLEKLAAIRASMAIFLSVGMIENVVEKLLTHYKSSTPAVVVSKASWPDEQIIRGTLADIAVKIRESGIRKTAMILVGDFLGSKYELSKLYDKSFSHEYRTAQ